MPQRNATRKDATAHCGRQLRTYNSSKAPFAANDSFFSQPGTSAIGFRPFGEKPRSSRDQRPRGKVALSQLPTYILYEHARDEGAKGNWEEVMNICRVLLKDRGEQPNKEMYAAILHSFVDSKNGTAGKVRKVLEEMGFWNKTDEALLGRPKIELDAWGCECVLEVLAVHPDFILRNEILEYMKSRWFMLSDRARNFVIAGMLRERHFEQALESLDDMVRNKARVEGWLFDKAIWMLLEFGEVEEAFYVLRLKESAKSKSNGTGAVELSNALWGALLDAAAHKQLVSGTPVICFSPRHGTNTAEARGDIPRMDNASSARLPQTRNWGLSIRTYSRLTTRRHPARYRCLSHFDGARHNLHHAPLRTAYIHISQRQQAPRSSVRDSHHGGCQLEDQHWDLRSSLLAFVGRKTRRG